jgi:outer membrane protein W
MRKLLTFVLLLMVSSAWAKEAAPTAGSPETTPAALETQTPVISVTPQTSPVSAVETPSGTSASENVSASVTPSATPSVMPTLPALSVALTPGVNNPVGEHFVFQLDGGTAMPASDSAVSIFNSGFGIDARIGYVFDDTFSLGLETGFYDLGATTTFLSQHGLSVSGATANMSHIPALLTLQFNLGDPGGPIQPYLLFAGGLAFDSNNLQGASFNTGVTTSWTNFEFDPGVGVAFVLDKKMSLFIQAKCAMDFDDNNSSDTNAQSSDAPIILVPIQLGLNFAL